MGLVADILSEVRVPRMVPIRQTFDETHIPAEEIPAVVAAQLSRLEIRERIRPGMEIAITVGSRGVANVAQITRSIADFVKAQGAMPFVVPAMGSHGGATAEGQKSILAGYGVTEETVGCEIRSSMETVEIGVTELGAPVYIDRNAWQADGIIACGRVKPHTAFRGPYESGVMKMLAIGLGKQRGAEVIHADGFGHFREYIPMFGKVILEKASILCGVALLENAYDQTREIVALTPAEIVEKEPELLERAKSYMPRILFEDCDVLIVDEMGKNLSGEGMDPNITGRFPTPYADGGIRAQRLVVLDLTEETHGNACGIGLADCTTRRLFNKIDLEQTYINSVTNTVTAVMKIPMIMESDKLAIQLAIKCCNDTNRSAPRVVRIKNTMEMERIEISEYMLAETAGNPGITVLDEPRELPFDEKDDLPL